MYDLIEGTVCLPVSNQTSSQSQKRHTDPQPGKPVQSRFALAERLRVEAQSLGSFNVNGKAALMMAAELLERDENNNAEMIAVLEISGYKDIPARIDATMIRRLLGYITPGA